MGRNCFFRHRSSLYLLPVFFTLVLFACSKVDIRYVSVYNGDNATNVVAVDTFAVQVSSVFLDSFQTSGAAAQLLGRYIDPFFGTITSQSYSDIGTPSPLPVINNYSIYDSIVLIERINRTFYGDTTKVQGFQVSQLTQTMDFPQNQRAFYNNNSIPYNPTVLGSAYVQINPTAGLTSQRRGDSVFITMPNSMGEELFGLTVQATGYTTESEYFSRIFQRTHRISGHQLSRSRIWFQGFTGTPDLLS